MPTKQEIADEIREIIDHDQYGRPASFNGTELMAIAAEFDIPLEEHGAGYTEDLRASILREGVGQPGTTAVDVNGTFRKPELRSIRDALQEEA